MTKLNQIEVIYANGEIKFYTLEPDKEITNIGSHPDNDIVLDAPGIEPFHITLDHRQEPYQLMLLTEGGLDTTLGGQPLPPYQFQSLQDWDRIQIGQHTLVLIEGETSSAVIPSVSTNDGVTKQPGWSQPITAAPTGPLPAQAASTSSRPTSPVASLPATRPGMPFTPTMTEQTRMSPPPSPTLGTPLAADRIWSHLPPDLEDDAIIVEVSQRECTINVEEGAVYQLTLTNGGPRVASFGVSIQGIPENWVTFSTTSVNLYEGQREMISLTIVPPRHSTSWAGTHHFALIVTSSNYPGRCTRLGLTVIINPYYEFGLDELSPRTQTVSWFAHAGQTTVTVFNRGNSEATFSLEGHDDEQACSYEFAVPGESLTLTGQAPLTLSFDSGLMTSEAQNYVAAIPVQIIPHSRPLLLRKRTHRFTLTVTPLQSQQPPLALPGELKQKPLLGFFSLLFLTLLFLTLIVLIFRPHINAFTIDDAVSEVRVEAGDEVVLGWQASPFANLRIASDVVGSDIGRLDGNQGRLTAAPKENTTYTLEASNLLSALIPFLAEKMERRVLVTPIEPEIKFEVLPAWIVVGGSVTMSLKVANAEEVTLLTNGAPETIPTAEHNGKRSLFPAEDTVYNVEASNRYGIRKAVATVVVVTPTGTPVPTPRVFFSVNPTRITLGESVTLNYVVSGADTVTINPIGPVPPQGAVSHSPQETTLYNLVAVKAGVPPVNLVQEVIVDIPTGTPTPTGTPAAPEIVEFNSTKTDYVLGGSDGDKIATLFWTVVGKVTDVQLANSSNVVFQSNLDPESRIDVSIDDKSTMFTLIAWNEDKSSRKSLTLNLQTPTPTATRPPTPTATPLPAQILSFEIVDDSDAITFMGGNQYNVRAGTNVTFRWSVNSAAVQAILTRANSPIGEGVPIGQQTQLIDGVGSQTYVLTAENEEGKPASASILVQITEQDPPNPPFAVTGFETPGVQNRLIWQWTPDPTKKSITGFRVYRADVPGSNYEMVTTTGASPMEFIDAIPDTCGKAYYVRALYLDRTGALLESADSVNNWQSSPCS